MRMTIEQFRRQYPNHPLVQGAQAQKTTNTRKRKTTSGRKGGVKTKSYLEGVFAQQAKALKLPVMQEEYAFHKTRRWRFDFAWPQFKLAVELEGGTLSRGRHVRPQGFQNDCEKYNKATLLGWQVLRFTSCDINSGRAIDTVVKAIANAKEN